jgi:chromate transporter
LIDGFKFASIAVIMEAAYKLSNGAIKNKFHLSLWVVSAILTTFFPSPSMAIFLIVFGALSNFFYDRHIG